MELFVKGNPFDHDSKTEPDPLRSLTNLPHELLLQIIDELDDAALCALGGTCRDFNYLVFPLFFDKHKIKSPSQGWIFGYQNISTIYYCFNKSIDRLVKEVEDMHAIVRRADEVKEFKVYLTDPDDWAIARAVRRLDKTQVLPLTPEEWTELYLRLLTAALKKGCQHMRLGGGGPFLEYLDRRQTAMAESVPTNALGNKATRYFDVIFPYESPLAGQPKLSLLSQSIEKLPPENTAVAESTVSQVLGGNSASNPPTPLFEGMKKRSRHGLLKWIEFFSKKNKNRSEVEDIASSTAAHNPKDFNIVSPGSSFIRLSDLNKPSAQPKAPAPAHTMGPPTPKIKTLILESDMLFASPSFLDWTNQLLCWCGSTLKHLELQCLETPSGVWYKALEDLLPRSHQLNLIGFKFTNDRYDLDSWLQSHVDAGPNASILSSFINTKHLQINAAYYVRIVNSASRLDLVAQVAGLFPNLNYLELKNQPGVLYKTTDHIPPVIEALRRHSPQVKQVKINNQIPIDIAEFESSEKK
ncbi:hypothetical protein H1R20_g13860, partial [Candolleomyces eurysporus]